MDNLKKYLKFSTTSSGSTNNREKATIKSAEN
jgi:hypothetical protein